MVPVGKAENQLRKMRQVSKNKASQQGKETKGKPESYEEDWS